MPPPRKKLPQMSNSELKAEALILATEVLSQRVGTLADAVQTNNKKIDLLQQEVNCKPDDTEVQYIAGMAALARRTHLKYALITAIASAIFSSTLVYLNAKDGIDERVRQANIACERNNARAEIDASVYEDVRKIIPPGPVSDRLKKAADELRSTMADCDTLHPTQGD